MRLENARHVLEGMEGSEKQLGPAVVDGLLTLTFNSDVKPLEVQPLTSTQRAHQCLFQRMHDLIIPSRRQE